MYILKKEQKIGKNTFVFQTFAFEVVTVNSPSFDEDTCHRQ